MSYVSNYPDFNCLVKLEKTINLGVHVLHCAFFSRSFACLSLCFNQPLMPLRTYNDVWGGSF